MTVKKAYSYSNGAISLTFIPSKCVHSGHCMRTLPLVFSPQQRPWVFIHNASSEDIMKAVNLCPSGALTYQISEMKG